MPGSYLSPASKESSKVGSGCTSDSLFPTQLDFVLNEISPTEWEN